jgi:hypothetical protein
LVNWTWRQLIAGNNDLGNRFDRQEHVYRNIGQSGGIVFNRPNRLCQGKGKRETIDDFRYENDPDTIFRIG